MRAEPARHSEVNLVSAILNPVLLPLGFAPGQEGTSRVGGGVLFCRADNSGGCDDLILDLAAGDGWRIVDVRYDGYPSQSWSPNYEGTSLAEQLHNLAQTLPSALPGPT